MLTSIEHDAPTVRKMARRLRRAEAVEYLLENHGIRRTVGTLAKYATVGGGPKFRCDGRYPVYAPADLDEWADSVLSPLVSSTSELAMAV